MILLFMLILCIPLAISALEIVVEHNYIEGILVLLCTLYCIFYLTTLL